MRILLTNDDGIDAPGLHALREIAAELSSDVWIVAPETNQSGKGHSLSLLEPLRMRKVGERVFAVRGTPTDCVIMAVRHVMKDGLPDLLLSGVNRGANMAEDMTYSGTIAAAFEGTLLGIRSIALSQSFGGDGGSARFGTAVAHGAGLVRRLLALEWEEGTLMNVNFPDREPDKIAGIRATRQGRRDPGLLDIEGRRDTWGEAYYWLAYERRRSKAAAGTDLEAIYGGAISVTPLHLDMTHDRTRERLEGLLGG
ncbi:MAG: 5'/3'-nucleotidase SurE [Hyphomicrobiaceae bacterium]